MEIEAQTGTGTAASFRNVSSSSSKGACMPLMIAAAESSSVWRSCVLASATHEAHLSNTQRQYGSCCMSTPSGQRQCAILGGGCCMFVLLICACSLGSVSASSTMPLHAAQSFMNEAQRPKVEKFEDELDQWGRPKKRLSNPIDVMPEDMQASCASCLLQLFTSRRPCMGL